AGRVAGCRYRRTGIRRRTGFSESAREAQGLRRVFAAALRQVIRLGQTGVSRRSQLPEAGTSEGLPKVGAFHFYYPAHFMEAGAHALSDAVTEGFAPSGPLCP